MRRHLALVLFVVASVSRCDCATPTGDDGTALDCRDDPAICKGDEVCTTDRVCALPTLTCDDAETACGTVCCAAGELCTNGACVVPQCTAGQTPCAAACCVDGEESCLRETCVNVELMGPCTDDDACEGDAFCDEVTGHCEPYGLPGGPTNDEECSVLIPLGVFNPAIQCEWQPVDSQTPCTLAVTGNPNYPHGLAAPECTGREVCVDPNPTDANAARFCMDPHRQLLATPTVVRFHFPDGSAGNLDGFSDERPSLVFPSYDSLDGGPPSSSANGVMRVVDGQTCRTLYTIDGIDPVTSLPLFTVPSSSAALGDIDLDGRPEIVAHAHGGGLWAFRYDDACDSFKPLWHSTNGDGSINQHGRGTPTTDTFGYESFSAIRWSGPALHDLDDDGAPEVLSTGAVYNAAGVVLFDADAAFEADFNFVANGQFPVVADVDLDGFPELVSGDKVFDWTGTAWAPQAGFVPGSPGDGFIAVGDFGPFPRRDGSPDTGFPEIVVVGTGASAVRVETSDGQTVFGPLPIPGSAAGGPPTVGDFDGDGQAEFAEAGGRAFTIFDLDCAVAAPAACTADAQCSAGFTCPTPGRCSLSSTPCADPAGSDCPSGETCIALSSSRVCVPDGCQGNGFRWSQISQDLSSSRTGSSIFDFEGDGEVEAVYADECYTRIYRGRDGVVLFSQFHSSCTWYENAIVADVDGDLRSEIVVGSNENCGTATACFNNAFVVSGNVRVDPIFPGLRCADGADCASGSCVDELCRCTADDQCGGGDFVCAPVLSGSTTVIDQNVCRAAYRVENSDGRPGITGLRIYRDSLDRWVGSRPIWNQHTYSITNVDDDGTIPRTSDVDNNWQVAGLNNYRQNVQGDLDADAFPDLTGGSDDDVVCRFNGDGSVSLPLSTRICNRGTLDVGPNVPIAVYEGETLRCTTQTATQIAPGQCEVVGCDITPAPTVATDYEIVVDDDGTGAGTRTECLEGNNSLFIRGLFCNKIGG